MSIFDFDSFTMQQRSLDLGLFVLSDEKEIQLTVCLPPFSQFYIVFNVIFLNLIYLPFPLLTKA